MEKVQIMFWLPKKMKEDVVEAMKSYNKNAVLEKMTYLKLFYPVIKKFIKDNKKKEGA